MAQEIFRSIKKLDTPRNRVLLVGTLALGLGVTACGEYHAPPPLPPTYPPVEYVLTQIALGTSTPTMGPVNLAFPETFLDKFVSAASAQELPEPTPTITVGTPPITATAAPRLQSIAYTTNVADENGRYYLPDAGPRREVTPQPRPTATVAPTAVIRYSQAVRYQPTHIRCPGNSSRVNELLGIEDSLSNWWVQNPFTGNFEGTLDGIFTVTISADAEYTLNGTRGQMQTLSGTNILRCPARHAITGASR